jgi:hypothetical protein
MTCTLATCANAKRLEQVKSKKMIKKEVTRIIFSFYATAIIDFKGILLLSM